MTSRIISIDDNGSLGDVISMFLPTIQAIVREARNLVSEVFPGVMEVPWRNQKTVGYAVGPRNMSEQFCYLAPYRNHLTIGFSMMRT